MGLAAAFVAASARAGRVNAAHCRKAGVNGAGVAVVTGGGFEREVLAADFGNTGIHSAGVAIVALRVGTRNEDALIVETQRLRARNVATVARGAVCFSCATVLARVGTAVSVGIGTGRKPSAEHHRDADLNVHDAHSSVAVHVWCTRGCHARWQRRRTQRGEYRQDATLNVGDVGGTAPIDVANG
jgi:hypothetical protein